MPDGNGHMPSGPLQVDMPLPDFVKAVAREAARTVIDQHVADEHRDVDTRVERLESRIGRLEISLARLIGFMAGSGLLGGVAGGIVAKALGA